MSCKWFFRSVLLLVFLFLCFFSPWTTNQVRADDCNITVKKTSIGHPGNWKDSDLILQPTDEEVQITINTDKIIPSYNYWLYGIDGLNEGWLIEHISNLGPDSHDVLQANPSGQSVTFTLNWNSSLYKETGINYPFKLIPRPGGKNYWEENKELQLKLIGMNPPLNKALHGDDQTICTFNLKVTNQCSSFGDITVTQDDRGAIIDFPDNNPLPSDNGDDYSFEQRRGIAFTNKKKVDFLTPISPTQTNRFLFVLDKNPTSEYFKDFYNLNLIYNNNGDDRYLCEMPFVPLENDIEKSLNNCEVKLPTSQGKFEINDIPLKMLNPQQTEWLPVGTRTFPGVGSATVSVNPFLIVTTLDEYYAAGYRSPSRYSRVEIAKEETFFSLCLQTQNNSNDACFPINAPNPAPVSKKIFTPNVSYIAYVAYHSSIISNSGFSVESASYILPSCSAPFKWDGTGVTPLPTVNPISPVPPGSTPLPTIDIRKERLCDSLPRKTAADRVKYSECTNCINEPVNGIPTALGCISTSAGGLVSSFFKVGLGVIGGIALLLLFYGFFLVLTSGGNPEQIQLGKQIVTAAITGLLLIIFSLFLLQFTAIDVLKLPGFERNNNPQCSITGNCFDDCMCRNTSSDCANFCRPTPIHVPGAGP